jgi:hypothetical protein
MKWYLVFPQPRFLKRHLPLIPSPPAPWGDKNVAMSPVCSSRRRRERERHKFCVTDKTNWEVYGLHRRGREGGCYCCCRAGAADQFQKSHNERFRSPLMRRAFVSVRMEILCEKDTKKEEKHKHPTKKSTGLNLASLGGESTAFVLLAPEFAWRDHRLLPI